MCSCCQEATAERARGRRGFRVEAASRTHYADSDCHGVDFAFVGVAEDKDLVVPLDNDAWLVRFLRPCKFYPESAYEQIKNYYSFKEKHSAVYRGLLPSKERNVFESNILTVCPNRDQLGRRILVLELGSESTRHIGWFKLFSIRSDSVDLCVLSFFREVEPQEGDPG